MPGIKCRLLPLALGAALLVAAPSATPRTYKWVDEHGTTHYSQTKPPNRQAEELSLQRGWTSGIEDGDVCNTVICRAARLDAKREAEARAAQDKRDQAAKAAAANPVFATPVKETDDEKIARLVAACKRSRGSNCDSDEEKRRMLLQNVELTQEERRALKGLSPAQQRRVLNERIPEQYRNIE